MNKLFNKYFWIERTQLRFTSKNKFDERKHPERKTITTTMEEKYIIFSPKRKKIV